MIPAETIREMWSEIKFEECSLCAAKPGSPDLCKSCLYNRKNVDIYNGIAETALELYARVEELERAYQDVQKEKEYWRDEAWDCEHCFHGEDGSGNCALCHGNEPPNQCAYCKANAE